MEVHTMHHRWRKVILLVLCLVLVTSLSLVACRDRNGDKEYSVFVKSLGGMGLSDVAVTVAYPDATISGKTDANGKYSFKAPAGEYGVTVGELPIGYTLVDNGGYKTSADKFELFIYASSAVIKDSIPDDKVYKEGDVIYDFSITDKTGGSDATYTLSEVLAEKKMVLLNFWNTNCSPCMSEMPEMELAYRQFKEDAEVFGINVPLMGSQRIPDIRNTRNREYTDADGNKFSLTFPLAIDDNEMPKHFGLTAIPVSVVVDRYGVIARIHSGSMDKSQFTELFDKYTSDNYVQDGTHGNGDKPGGGETLEWTKCDVAQPDYNEIARTVNGSHFNGTWYPETEANAAEYSWPWILGETNGEKYICPSNHEVNLSYAIIYTEVTITKADIDNGGNVVLVFDLQWSTENLSDIFYVMINGKYVYEYSGVEQWGKWQECYAMVADEPGTYTLALVYMKDQQLSEGADTVRIKNVHLISISEIAVGSLDMPRDAARGWNGTNFTNYINVVKDDEGFYHKDSKTGPYIVAELMETTPFHKRLNTTWSISEYAVNNYFNYNEGRILSDEPGYDPSKDDTDAIALWCMAANNSELYGLTLVDDDLIALLNKFIKTQVSNFNDNMWLELCSYFDHYGTDKNDKGISTPDRNPIRGVLDKTALKMVDAYDGEFEDLDDIPDQYKNFVLLDRLIVPRGFKYVFTPKKDGVYRFRSQSKELADTMAWLYPYGCDVQLVSSDMQLEDPNYDYNFIMTYYLEAGKQYIVAVCFADMLGTGEFTFTTEYLGESYYSWQYASTRFYTAEDDEFEDGFVGVTNIMYVQPVAHTDEDGVIRYYNAKKDKNGNYIKDKAGNYIANLNDPIYVDFLTGARFFESGSLAASLEWYSKEQVCKTLSGIFSRLWGKPVGKDGWPATMPLRTIKGSQVGSSDWDSIRESLYLIYGDNCIVADEDVAIIQQLMKANTVGDVADILIANYLSLFNFTKWRPEGDYDIDEKYFVDYTDLVKDYYRKALDNKGRADRGYADAGSVHLTQELLEALNMFCKRIGTFAELDTDWIRLCAHYEYIGPYTDAE